MERQRIEETLALLQAQVAVQHLMPRATLRPQPDPMALFEPWHAVRADADRTDLAAMHAQPAPRATRARPHQRRLSKRAPRPAAPADRGPSS